MNVTTTTRTVKIDASADYWELFDEPGRDEAADTLNRCIEALVAEGLDASQISRRMSLPMRDYASLGACDSEAFHALRSILTKIFPGYED